jgi:hypothetical protein
MIALLIACSDAGITSEQVKQFHEQSHPVSDVAVGEEIDAYFDYSLGMGEGMKATAAQNQALSDFLRGRRVRYFRVGNTPEPEGIADMASPQANLLNLENFRDIGSRLHRVIDLAVAAESRQSVFVTDFEATLDDKVLTPGAPKPHRIDTKAWAQEPFRRWLTAGHRIDIFARRYSKPDWWFGDGRTLIDNWIYTIIFTPGPLLRDRAAYDRSLLAFLLEEHARRASESERHFAYWADDVAVGARNAPNTGNAHPDSPVQDVLVGQWHPPFDYHVFGYGDVQEWLAGAGDDRRLLNGVTIEPRIAFAPSVTLGLQVHDVTAAIATLSEALEPPEPPDTLVNEETGAITLLDPRTGKPAAAAVRQPVRVAAGTPAPGVLTLVHNAKTHRVQRPGRHDGLPGRRRRGGRRSARRQGGSGRAHAVVRGRLSRDGAQRKPAAGPA